MSFAVFSCSNFRTPPKLPRVTLLTSAPDQLLDTSTPTAMRLERTSMTLSFTWETTYTSTRGVANEPRFLARRCSSSTTTALATAKQVRLRCAQRNDADSRASTGPTPTCNCSPRTTPGSRPGTITVSQIILRALDSRRLRLGRVLRQRVPRRLQRSQQHRGLVSQGGSQGYRRHPQGQRRAGLFRMDAYPVGCLGGGGRRSSLLTGPSRQADLDDGLRVWRSFQMGKLLDIIMLDTRNYDRSITTLGDFHLCARRHGQ